MKYLSVCSGIEAASVAWLPLGWKPWAFSEIDRFPSAVLAHHYPNTPNLGDMTAYKEWPDASLDVLCGGTPCQSFSNAGLRAGLDDPRGQLMLTFGAVAAKYRPRWLVWENVPGVLSSNGGRDFGAFLGLLGFLGYGFAYRVLDAQFVRVDGHGRAVPQRRNRVFVVGCLGDWRSAAAVLLERESLRGDPAPRRQAGSRVAATLTRGAESGGKGGYAGRRQEDDVSIVAGALAGTGPGAGWRIGADEAAANHCIAIQGSMIGRADDAGPAASGLDFTGASFTLTKQDQHAVAMCLNAKGGGGRLDAESETLIPTNGGIFDVAPTITAQFGEQTGQDAMNAGLVVHTLRGEGFDASEDGTGRGTPLVPVCFDPTQITSRENRSNPQPGDPCHTLAKGAHAPAIAFNARQDPINGPIDTDGSTNGVMVPSMQVRRLTPEECEALQGFPRGYTRIPNWNGWRAMDASETPEWCIADGLEVRRSPFGKWRVRDVDGPRYKALGNSWATNCARWIGRRIALVDSLLLKDAA